MRKGEVATAAALQDIGRVRLGSPRHEERLSGQSVQDEAPLPCSNASDEMNSAIQRGRRSAHGRHEALDRPGEGLHV